MNIRIVNLRNYKLNPGETLIKVDRTSPLGNPFIMHNESERDKVCDEYDEWFHKIMLDGSGYHGGAKDYLLQIIYFVIEHDIALGCWCYPKRCHAETIKNYIEKILD